MKKTLFSALLSFAVLIQNVTIESTALEAISVPLEDDVMLLDTYGRIYVHIQNESSLHITVDKTEPEGIFRYYDADIFNESSDTEKTYLLELSCCEYLVDSGEYASQYTLNIEAADDRKSMYNQNIVIKDPGFENVSGTEYHFYITTELSDHSDYNIIGANEYTKDEGVLLCEQYIKLLYKDILKGDVNEDGVVGISDASFVLSCYASLSSGLGIESDPDLADIDGDGKIQISDAGYILKYYALFATGIEPVWEDIIS